MDLAFTPEEQAFRAEIRAWVRAHLPPELAHKGGPLVALLPRQPGAREPRWAHLLCGAPAPELLAEAGGAAGLGVGPGAELAAQLSAQLAALAARVQALEQQVQDLQQRLEQAGV